jgi:HD superfamily phosphodiesterase
MIPHNNTIFELWDTYDLPPQKRIHCQLVCDVADIITSALEKKSIQIDKELVHASALLHDIDKHMTKLPNERHPDAAVRMLVHEGMEEVAEVVRRHPLHAILDQTICPTTIEQKIVYISDKMVKYAFIGLEERFRLWREEEMGKEEREMLERTYPLVKKLQEELMTLSGLTEQGIKLALEERKGQ